MPEKYSRQDGLAGLGFLISAMETQPGEDGDRGKSFPRSDAEDMSRGTRFIPGEVTLARRAGKKVEFVSNCGPCCWYWQMRGHRIYHYDPVTHNAIARANGHKFEGDFKGDAGQCPACGNKHTNGGKH